jgi:hypothetical protein
MLKCVQLGKSAMQQCSSECHWRNLPFTTEASTAGTCLVLPDTCLVPFAGMVQGCRCLARALQFVESFILLNNATKHLKVLCVCSSVVHRRGAGLPLFGKSFAYLCARASSATDSHLLCTTGSSAGVVLGCRYLAGALPPLGPSSYFQLTPLSA